MLKLKKIGIVLLSMMVVGINLLVAIPSQADPPPWAPAHGHRAKQYKYIYYPASQVYYSPALGRYYYMNSGAWTFAPTAPIGVRLGNGVSIELGGTTPYVYHPVVIERYPVVVVP